MVKFCKRLKELRKEINKTQKDISKDLKIGQAAYTNWELGRREPSLEMLIIIAKYYNVSIDFLLGITDIRDSYYNDEKLSQYVNSTIKALREYEDKE